MPPFSWDDVRYEFKLINRAKDNLAFIWIFSNNPNTLKVLQVLEICTDFVDLMSETGLNRGQINRAVSQINVKIEKEFGIERSVQTSQTKRGYPNLYKLLPCIKIREIKVTV